MLTGDIKEFGIHNLIQIPNFTSKTGKLILQVGDKEYNIYYEDGKLVHAEAEGKTGEDAFYFIMERKLTGKFKFEQTPSVPMVTIDKPLQHLILLAAKQEDEKRQHEQRYSERKIEEILNGLLPKHDLFFAAFIEKENKLAVIVNPQEIRGIEEELLSNSLSKILEVLDVERLIGTSLNYQFAIGKISLGWVFIGVGNSFPMGMLATKMKNVLTEFE